MMTSNVFIAATALAVASFGASVSYAQSAPDHRFYAGVSVGRSSVDDRASAPAQVGTSLQFPPFLDSVTIHGLPFRDHSTSWSAFAGYRANEYIGVEAGYTDHGHFGWSPGRSRVFLDSYELGMKELSFGATLRYPFAERFAVTGGAGITRSKFDVTGSIAVLILDPGTAIIPGFPVGIQNVPLSTPPDETGGYWKAGVNWRITDKLETSLSYGKHDLHVLEVKTSTLSLMYAF